MRESFPYQKTAIAMQQIANKIQRDFVEQAPQPGQNPYATGSLRDSIRVTAYSRGVDNWTIAATYNDYGNYVAFGTGRHYNAAAFAQRENFFEIPSPQRYKYLGNGIRPQYWLSLSRKEREYTKLINDAIQLDLQSFVTSTIKNLTA